MRFDFSVKSLLNLDPRIDSNERYMEVFAILHHLPKDEATENRFEGCLLNNCNYLSDKLEPRCNEHKWLLDIGFDLRKRLAYRHLPPQPQEIHPDPRLHLVITRDNLLEDSISKIVDAEATSLARGISITFHNEAGQGDGVLRDWFVSLASEMVDESHGAFLSSGDDPDDLVARDAARFYPKPGALKDANFYICFGRLIALALIHEIQIGIALDRCLFVQFREDDLRLDDIRDTSPRLYNSYKEVLMYSEEDFPNSIYWGDDDGDDDDEDNTVLKYADREQFILQKIHAQFVEAIQTQICQILQGFDDVIPSAHRIEFFQILKPNDLDCMIRGILDLDVEEWRNHTTYEGAFSNIDPHIDWFWQCVSHLSKEGKRNLLFFWTSEKYLPLGGFQALDPLVIRNGQASSDHLPVATTCERRLTIPVYLSYKAMFEKLLLVSEFVDRTFEFE